ncbi:MAG: hypothetical protein HFI16_06050 [Lachnospiraceae bacterium]|nr:hypothetical protein [Lachnospiraceae bacterium]
MNLYTSVYMACLFGTVISGAVTIFLFVRLDIKTALRVLGKRGKQKKTKAVKRSRKREVVKSQDAAPKTVLLHLQNESFRVVEEILLIHTDEMI